MANLCLLSEDGALAKHWEIGDRPLSVGRGAAVDVRLDDEGLSRRHFVVLREGEDYIIKDLGSRNGTWVDGERAVSARLEEDHRILAGRTQFRFSKQRPAAANGAHASMGPHGTVILPVAA
jgi:pSer/pThr/pTyr-binding forkhead associated (FHA) protein